MSANTTTAAAAPEATTAAAATTATTAAAPAAADNVLKPTEPAAAALAQTAAGEAAATAAISKSAEEGRRLYIGNLAYAATEAELKDFFKEYTVESTSIPMNPRTNRPVGYAFVDLASVEQAQAAIAALSGKEILERKVSVQVAQKPDLHKDGENGEGRKRGQNRTRGRGRGRGGRFNRSGRRTNSNGEESGETTQSGNEQAAAPLADSTNDNAQHEHAKDSSKPRRAPRHRGPPEDGIPSKTKVMVANLPYDLHEDKLKEIFAAYNPVSAKVALRPIPRFMVKKLQARNEPRKGRGFGFVTLANEEMQQKAVKEMSGKEVEGREIAVKIAIDSPGKEDAHDTEDGAEKKEGEKEGVAAAAPAAAADAAPASAPAEEKKDAAPAAAAAATA